MSCTEGVRRASIRAAHGRLLVAGIPRMTRPRKRKNADNLSGFTVIDPGGNWIRIMAATAEPDDHEVAPSRLARVMQNAVVMGDSHGYDGRAAKILTIDARPSETERLTPPASRRARRLVRELIG